MNHNSSSNRSICTRSHLLTPAEPMIKANPTLCPYITADSVDAVRGGTRSTCKERRITLSATSCQQPRHSFLFLLLVLLLRPPRMGAHYCSRKESMYATQLSRTSHVCSSQDTEKKAGRHAIPQRGQLPSLLCLFLSLFLGFRPLSMDLTTYLKCCACKTTPGSTDTPCSGRSSPMRIQREASD